jgi:D-beta-D-heptose 7-phosphate kinase / D-beta-D-heptose 1-phosphate adenosyltransferase
LDLIEKFAGLEVLVIGDVILDRYLEGTSTRSCPEDAEAPVIDEDLEIIGLGGAANVAANIAALNPYHVTLLGVRGEDRDGDLFTDLMRIIGIRDRTSTDASRSTLAKTRISSGGKLRSRIDRGSTHNVTDPFESEVIARIILAWDSADFVIVADYDKGVMTPEVIATIERLNRAHRKTLVVNAKYPGRYRDCRPTAVTMNYAEAMRFCLDIRTFYPSTRAERIGLLSPHLLDMTGAETVAVTLDSAGVMTFCRDSKTPQTMPNPDKLVNTSGAGDTFLAAFALGLGAGGNRWEAAELGQRAADVVVAKPYTSTCTAEELRGRFAPKPTVTPDLVLATGVFDVLHVGHLGLLQQARAMGNRLVVGINTDASVRRHKGLGRPINDFPDRVRMLAALRCVSDVAGFDGPTPEDLIRELRPAVFVKGGDYTRETLPEADLVESYGGKVVIIPRLDDHSSTSIIDRMQAKPCQSGSASTSPEPCLNGV